MFEALQASIKNQEMEQRINDILVTEGSTREGKQS